MLNILFYTFQDGHMVSDKEFFRFQKGFLKSDMNLIRWHKDKGIYTEPYDIILVKGFSHTWDEIPHDKPTVMYSIGTEWKKGINLLEANEPIRELYEESAAVVHISKYCKAITQKVFNEERTDEYVIIPADEPKLPDTYPEFNGRLKLATTCIPRPVKRLEETKRLCEKYGIELIVAEGNVDDFSYYHDCHGYIHLSRKEGMPNTVLEALAYGLPCIVTNHGGAKEVAQVIILNDSEDTMWNMDDVETVDDLLFEEAIKKFKDNLPELRLRVRERVLTELNDKVCADKFKEVFEQILK
jgi:glycosyltransferase involved in cell wall biosynthesis